MSEEGRLNMRQMMQMPPPPKAERNPVPPFEASRDISPKDWKKIEESLAGWIERAVESTTWGQRDLVYVSSVELLKPGLVVLTDAVRESIIKTVRNQRWVNEHTKALYAEMLATLGIPLERNTFPTIFGKSTYDIRPNLNELARLLENVPRSGGGDWDAFLHIAQSMKRFGADMAELVTPSDWEAINAFVKAKRENPNRSGGNHVTTFFKTFSAIRILDPSFPITDEDWKLMKDSLDTYRADSSFFIENAASATIIAAKNIQTYDGRLILTAPDSVLQKREAKEEVPPVPPLAHLP